MFHLFSQHFPPPPPIAAALEGHRSEAAELEALRQGRRVHAGGG